MAWVLPPSSLQLRRTSLERFSKPSKQGCSGGRGSGGAQHPLLKFSKKVGGSAPSSFELGCSRKSCKATKAAKNCCFITGQLLMIKQAKETRTIDRLKRITNLMCMKYVQSLTYKDGKYLFCLHNRKCVNSKSNQLVINFKIKIIPYPCYKYFMCIFLPFFMGGASPPLFAKNCF